jgi:hypothetical protein
MNSIVNSMMAEVEALVVASGIVNTAKIDEILGKLDLLYPHEIETITDWVDRMSGLALAIDKITERCEALEELVEEDPGYNEELYQTIIDAACDWRFYRDEHKDSLHRKPPGSIKRIVSDVMIALYVRLDARAEEMLLTMEERQAV